MDSLPSLEPKEHPQFTPHTPDPTGDLRGGSEVHNPGPLFKESPNYMKQRTCIPLGCHGPQTLNHAPHWYDNGTDMAHGHFIMAHSEGTRNRRTCEVLGTLPIIEAAAH